MTVDESEWHKLDSSLVVQLKMVNSNLRSGYDLSFTKAGAIDSNRLRLISCAIINSHPSCMKIFIHAMKQRMKSHNKLS